MRFFRRFLFFIYSGEICVFVRPFRFLLMNASFKNGRTFRFADYKEEEELQRHNEKFYRISLVEEVLVSRFRTPLPHEKSLDLTAADIFGELQTVNPAAMRGSNPMRFGQILIRAGLKRKHTEYGNVYEVVKREK